MNIPKPPMGGLEAMKILRREFGIKEPRVKRIEISADATGLCEIRVTRYVERQEKQIEENE